MKKILIALTISVLFVFLSAPAWALQVSYSGIVGISHSQNVDSWVKTYSWTFHNSDVFLPQFNSADGTLLGVTLELDVDLNSDVRLWQGVWGDSIPYTLTPNMTASASTLDAIVSETFYGVAGYQGWHYHHYDLIGSDSEASPSALAGFIGTGNVTIDLIGSSYFSVGGDPWDDLWPDYLNSSGVAEITLTYDYNPVPEPTTMLLLCAGLIGLAGFRRKRFQA